MSALLLPALAAGSSGQGALYVDDVFSTYLYTGNGSTQTINNGIDLAGKGGLVWIKERNGTSSNVLVDTVRGATNNIYSNAISAQESRSSVTSFDSNGFSIGNYSLTNLNGNPYASWTFRKAPKFFDVVTYTGNGVTGRQIAHSLGVQAGFITVKATSTTGDWNSYHRSATGDLKLNLTDAQTASRAIITAADASTFTVSGAANTNGVSYVAYLWAHDPSAEGIIQCGSYAGTSAAGNPINLGWEPQYVLIKNVSDGTTNWNCFDSMRGLVYGANDPSLRPNTSESEVSISAIRPTATGFEHEWSFIETNASGSNYIYLAIRRPNKPPTSGTQVYNAFTVSSIPKTSGIGFPHDLVINEGTAGNAALWGSRLQGPKQYLDSSSTTAEVTAGAAPWAFDKQDNGYVYYASPSIAWFFRRAPGFFDVVCDAGTGAAHAIAHNLTKAPELIIRKSRSAATQWEVWHSALAATEKLVLNSNAAKVTDATAWNSTLPTATQFTVGTGANVNANAATFVTYLFATLAGIGKVGSYTGNGSSQTIDCGFSTGARFFLVKATSTTGSWWVYDSARGIVSAADPALQLNSTAAEITSADAVDPTSVGIIVNQEPTCSINATGVSYIFLAVA